MSQIIERNRLDIVRAFRWWEIEQPRKTTRPQNRRNG